MTESLFILEITEGNEKFEYEYRCLQHAREHLNNRKIRYNTRV